MKIRNLDNDSLEKYMDEAYKYLNRLEIDDLLIITADHGCDPTVPGTDHTRERVPVLVYTRQGQGCDLGTLIGFDHVANFVKDWIF